MGTYQKSAIDQLWTLKADPKNKNDNEFIVFNALRSPQLQDILADTASKQDSAWLGFVFVVLQIVNSSAGKAIDFNSLMAKIRDFRSKAVDAARRKGAQHQPSQTCVARWFYLQH